MTWGAVISYTFWLSSYRRKKNYLLDDGEGALSLVSTLMPITPKGNSGRTTVQWSDTKQRSGK